MQQQVHLTALLEQRWCLLPVHQQGVGPAPAAAGVAAVAVVQPGCTHLWHFWSADDLALVPVVAVPGKDLYSHIWQRSTVSCTVLNVLTRPALPPGADYREWALGSRGGCKGCSWAAAAGLAFGFPTHHTQPCSQLLRCMYQC